MRNPEMPVSIGENFLIRDAKASKPLTAAVIDIRYVEDEERVWQIAGLRRLGTPRTRFELSTSRRINYGAYVNRDGRYTFLRLEILSFEELIRYFDNGTREAVEEFIRVNQNYGLIDRMR